MSNRPNQSKPSYELIDVDDDDTNDNNNDIEHNHNTTTRNNNIITTNTTKAAVGNQPTISNNNNNNNNSNSSPVRAFTLPTGEIMDGKNTLQSFAITKPKTNHNNINRNITTTSIVKKTLTSPPPPQQQQSNVIPPFFTLPNGQMMDSKNTLQSFDNINTPNTSNTNTNVQVANVIIPPLSTRTTPTTSTTTTQTGSDTYHNDIGIKNSNNNVVKDAIVNTASHVTAIATSTDSTIVATTSTTNTSMNPTSDHTTTNNNHNNIGHAIAAVGIGTTNRIDSTNVIHAVAVQSFAVAEAETIDPTNIQSSSEPLNSSSKRNTIMIYIAVFFGTIIVAIIAGVGAVLVKNSNESTPLNTTPTTTTLAPITNPTTVIIPTFVVTPLVPQVPNQNPIAIQPQSSKPDVVVVSPNTNNPIITNVPTSFPIQSMNYNVTTTNNNTSNQATLASLRVACNFLGYTNITSCKSIKDYNGEPVGSTIPTEIGLLTQLTYLGLDFTFYQLTGTIPSSLGNLVQLQGLWLRSNALTGTISSSLGNLLQLTDLSLSTNQLTGTIPSSLGNLTQLTYLNLYSNHLTGTIPSSLEQLTSLIVLYLYNNTQLRGTIPSSLCSLTDLSGDILIDCDNIVCSCCLSGYDDNGNPIPCSQ